MAKHFFMIKTLLSSISKNSITLNPEFFAENEKANNWIGKTPASENAIETTEKRLAIKPPQDVVDLYKISNGTTEILHQTFSGFDAIETIDWLKNLQPDTIGAYADMGEEYLETLKNSIVIAGANQPHMVLIIQPYLKTKDWRYWEFAHYIPGENEFFGIEKYLERLNQFLKDKLKNKSSV
jgi:hypothetical protein